MAWARYYLIPTDPHPEQWGCDLCPKYLDLFRGEAVDALPPKETTVAKDSRTWLRPYYLIKIRADKRAAFGELEKQPDVVSVQLGEAARLAAIGVDLVGANELAELERRIVAWLAGESRNFAEVLPLAADEVVD